MSIVVPTDLEDAPTVAQEIIGTSAAAAQTPPPPTHYIVDGTASACPDNRYTDSAGNQPPLDDDPLCVLELDACPIDPLDATSRLAQSSDYPGFCEKMYREADSGTIVYNACAASKGVVIKLDPLLVTPDRTCRIIVPRTCPPNLNRIDDRQCRRVIRRTWSCPSGAIPRNEFGTCYQQPTGSISGIHPACGTGAPTFVVSSCAEYVDMDYERSLGTADCSDYSTDNGYTTTTYTSTIVLSDVSSNSYWCSYDAALLDVACHNATPSCAVIDARCIKRESRHGGCDAIAQALRCRELQATYKASARTAADLATVTSAGCIPCVSVPFKPKYTDCPSEHTPSQRPVVTTDTSMASVLKNKRGTDDCGNPPRGAVEWRATHVSGHPVVNSIVMLDIIDIPTVMITRHYFNPSERKADVNITNWLAIDKRERLIYPRSGLLDIPIITYRDSVSGTYNSLNQLATAGECHVAGHPQFRVRATELWPDSDRAEIESLFGGAALEWWYGTNGLTMRQKAAYAAGRGLELLDNLTAPERVSEINRRNRFRSVEVDCDNQAIDTTPPDGFAQSSREPSWCRWIPSKAGYYRLEAVGAWQLESFSTLRGWNANAVVHTDYSVSPPANTYAADRINDFFWNEMGTINKAHKFISLNLPATGPDKLPLGIDINNNNRDGWCYRWNGGAWKSKRDPGAPGERIRDPDCFEQDLIAMGAFMTDAVGDPILDSNGDYQVDLAKAGLRLVPAPSATAPAIQDTYELLPADSDEDLVFEGDINSVTRCHPVDLRLHCTATSTEYHYTTSAPVGIIVHDVRTYTRLSD